MKNHVRIQLDLHPQEANALDQLKTQCRLRSRKDAVKTALAIIEWINRETSAGRKIVSVGPDQVSYLAVPGLTQRTQEG